LGSLTSVQLDFGCVAARHFSDSRTVDLKDYLVARPKEVDRALDRFLPKATTKPTTDS
jgi:hypothetical protein